MAEQDAFGYYDEDFEGRRLPPSVTAPRPGIIERAIVFAGTQALRAFLNFDPELLEQIETAQPKSQNPSK